MKKSIVSIIVPCILSVFACNSFLSNPNDTDELIDTGELTCSIDTTSIPEEVTSITGFMHNDSCDTINLLNFSINEYSASKITEEIPVGEWYIAVNAYNTDDQRCYTGRCTTYVYNNTVTEVDLNLSRIDLDTSGTINLEVTWGEDNNNHQQPDTSTYLLNANGYTGVIKMAINNSNILYGNGIINKDGVTWEDCLTEFQLINTSVNSSQTWKGETIKRIEFNRSDINQTWHGWGSYNGNFYAGYFEGNASAGDKKSPWVISKIDSSILKKDVNESTLKGHYTLTANGYMGWLELSNDTGNITGSGKFTTDGYTGETISSPFTLEQVLITNIESWKGRDIKELRFKRSDIDQTWYGWQTWDGKMLAGYFIDDGSAGGTEFGWYAVKNTSGNSD